MWEIWRKLQQKITATPHSELYTFKKNCEQLIQKYEQLLQQISEYMRNNRSLLNPQDTGETVLEEDPNQFYLNSFFFLSIKNDLLQITKECESLLVQGTNRLVDVHYKNETMKVLLSQLKELRDYSDQIEEALVDFEEKLIEMEEVLASRSLSN